jgi:hypothetical protein
LVWATPLENTSHKLGHGTMPIGSRNGSSVLCEKDIPLIFGSYAGGTSAADAGVPFGVSAATVLSIVRRSIWGHVVIDQELLATAQARTRTNLERSWEKAARRRQERGPSLLSSR